MSKLTEFQQREREHYKQIISEAKEIFPRGTMIEYSMIWGMGGLKVGVVHAVIGTSLRAFPTNGDDFIHVVSFGDVTRILSQDEINQLTNKDEVHRILREMEIKDKQEDTANEQVGSVDSV